MSKPLVITLSHDLGKAEAIRRLREGADYLQSRHADKIAAVDTSWAGERLNFAVTALMQKATGFIDVDDSKVTLTVTLPFLLAMMADKARSLIVKEGTLLLEKK